MNPFLSAQSEKHTQTSNEASPEIILMAILKNELQSLKQVIFLLQTEHTAILERDIKSIDQLLDRKLMLLSQLEQLDKQRQNFFEQQSGITYSNTNFSYFIQQHPSEDIKSMWLSIKSKLPECKKQNEINGRMIDIQKENNDQILQLLTGRPQSKTQTYSHLGQTSMQKRNALYTAV
ncbi:MAG: flagellar protein FlgN [Gammaproteobacteria bacterium]|nr:flagellar protein FlgN [Gammaproteobacteria bacterium]